MALSLEQGVEAIKDPQCNVECWWADLQTISCNYDVVHKLFSSLPESEVY